MHLKGLIKVIMEKEIKEKIKITVFDANSVLSICFVDKEMGNPCLNTLSHLQTKLKLLMGF